MIPKERLDLIRSEIGKVIQNATFMIVEPVSDHVMAVDFSAELHWALVAYSGHSNGNVYICSSEELARIIAGNMLGISSPDIVSTEQEIDSFKELANIITGRMLLLLYGNEVVFRLSPPVYFRECPLKSEFSLANKFTYDCEEMFFNVILAQQS